jgi:dTDP-4-amino-4,6-dideoxygalactose transaminase
LLGTNSRLDEIQAALLRVKLAHLDGWNEQRRTLAARYEAGLGDCAELALPIVPRDVEHVFHLYVVRTPLRNRLRSYLAGTNVQTSVHYPKVVPMQPAYASLGYEKGSFPHAEAVTKEILSLPLFPQLSDHEQEQVVRLVRFFFAMR